MKILGWVGWPLCLLCTCLTSHKSWITSLVTKGTLSTPCFINCSLWAYGLFQKERDIPRCSQCTRDHLLVWSLSQPCNHEREWGQKTGHSLEFDFVVLPAQLTSRKTDEISVVFTQPLVSCLDTKDNWEARDFCPASLLDQQKNGCCPKSCICNLGYNEDYKNA